MTPTEQAAFDEWHEQDHSCCIGHASSICFDGAEWGIAYERKRAAWVATRFRFDPCGADMIDTVTVCKIPHWIAAKIEKGEDG